MKKDNFFGFTLLAPSEVSVTDLGTTGAPHLLWGAEGPQEAPRGPGPPGGSVTEASSTVYWAKRPRTTQEGP